MVNAFRHLARLSEGAGGKVLGIARVAVWLDYDGSWGGIIEPLSGELPRSVTITGDQTIWYLALDDGREGTIDVVPSQFEADGAHPLTFCGRGELTRPGEMQRG